MSFTARITRTPLIHDPDQAAQVAPIAGGLPGAFARLVAATASCSPYLKSLILAERDWLETLACEAPEAQLSALLARARALDPDQMADGLRAVKARVALLTALADLGGVWDLFEVTGALSDFADTALDTALRSLVAADIERGRLPGLTEADVATAGGMVVLAMGKMGARELNYSSDIDLICVFDETRFAAADRSEARAAFVRITRKLTALLSENTAKGYVFRTDLRLRPEPSVTPVCLSMEAAERYYESVGRTWERAAFIKARPAAGDLDAGARFLDRLTPFVWRRHLDYAAIRDTHDMRLKIRAHKGGQGRLTLEGHDMKLGAGGIREIEFFAQTHQLITGGRDPDLRQRDTCGALAALAQKGWVEADTAAQLTLRYRQHREIEHRVQMIHDAQTHALPRSAEGFDRLARFCGAGDTARFRAELSDRLRDVAARMDPFYTPQQTHDEAPSDLPPDLPARADEAARRWRGYPALRSARARDLFDAIRPRLLQGLARATRPDEALAQFDRFLSGLPAGVQLFSLFEAKPQLVDLLLDICATAPGLAQYLARNSGVLDAVIAGRFFADWPGAYALRNDLKNNLQNIDDYEKKLDHARRWAKEWHFRIGVHHLRGLIDGAAAGAQYADLAEAVVGALFDPVADEFARRYGPAPGRGALVLGMGSLGAGRLNAASDLDLIVIFDAAGTDQSSGPRPLSARAWYARFTQALVTALSAPMAEGRLYEVDMRLRPSGRQGPVATALTAFMTYQEEEAWTWEHLALTRARAIAGAAPLAREVEAFRRALLAEKSGAGAGVREGILADVGDMRRRLAREKPASGIWDVKSGPGGMTDMELAAETAALIAADPARAVADQIAAGVASGFLSAADGQTLDASYALLSQVNQVARLVTQGRIAPEDLGQGALAFLMRETGFDAAPALEAAVARAKTAAADVIDARIGRGRTEDQNGRT